MNNPAPPSFREKLTYLKCTLKDGTEFIEHLADYQIDAIIAAAVEALPEKYVNNTIPEKNDYITGEIIGWNEAIDQANANLKGDNHNA